MTPLAHAGASLPGAVLAPLLAGALYLRRARTLAGTPRAVPGWRAACFAAGLALASASVLALDELAGDVFWAHMLEHLLLADLGALLVVLGLTGPLLAPLLRLRGLRWLRLAGHPLVALPLWAADLYVWHVPALYLAAVRHPAVHAAEHAMFAGLGVAMWMALLGPLPRPAWFGNLARLVYVVAVRLLGAVLANVLLWSGQAIYGGYAAGEARRGISPGADQVLGGAIMMVEGSLVTLGLFAWLFVRAARESEERQALLDLAAARGVALDEARAARAVGAGRGEELRRRILGG